MSNQGHARAVQAQAYGKTSSGGWLTRLTAGGLIFTGATAASMAVVTAVMPTANEEVRMVLGGLDRLGLDKGPLAMFGVAFIGLGMVLSRLGKIGGGGQDAADAAAHAEQASTEIENVSAIMGTLQAEIGALRNEVASARQEIRESAVHDTPSTSGDDTANDPMFRLAASLDQLGARVDKRIDSSRKEMLAAVTEMSQTIQDVTQEQTEAAREQRTEFEGLRMDMADLHAEISRVSDDVADDDEEDEEDEYTELDSTQAASAPSLPVQALSVAPPISALPRELSEQLAPPQVEPSPTAEMPSAPLPSAPTAPSPAAGTSERFNFPLPPPAIPHPSEGLELLDEMEDGISEEVDTTPPLFPDLEKGEY